MLTFDENGFLAPADAISTTLQLLENEFVTTIGTETRKRLFEKMLRYLDALKTLTNEDQLTVWVNGSFVTKKPNPADIDLVVFVPWTKMEEFSSAIRSFSSPNTFGNYGVDGYLVRIYEPTHKYHILTHSDRLHWLHDFSRTQPNRKGKVFKKGFLEIQY